jgi:type I restriction enzyme M protein
VIVPNGVLFGGNKAAVKIRELILNEYGLQAVINLPSGAFRPYAGVGTAILILDKSKSKRKKDDSIWFYDVTADGFSLDDKRTPIETNDIPDVLAKWEKREEGTNSYRVPIAKILESEDLSLSVGRYKPVINQVTKHDVPKDILNEVLEIEIEIQNKIKTLLKKIGKR